MHSSKAKVSVVTRTKDRPLTLERVANTLKQQLFQDFVWVVVNDGGDTVPVERIVSSSEVTHVVIHHATSQGRASAANVGMFATDTEYLVWLDDDDTWHPRFLLETVNFLDSSQGRYEGVVTHTQVIREKMVDGALVPVGNGKRYMPKHITIESLMGDNPFPIISFVFSRRLLETVGGVDESITHCEDWYFNQKAIMHYRIAVIPEILAYYHQRQRSDSKAYANKVTSSSIAQLEECLVWKDDLVRKSIKSGMIDHGLLLMLGRLDWSLGRVEPFITRCANACQRLGLVFLGRATKKGVQWVQTLFRVIMRREPDGRHFKNTTND
jgi:glycosyltransferase involved in cell wall biosynthesis